MKKKHSSKSFILLSVVLLLGGCAEIFVTTVKVLLGGPQYAHEYYLEYTIDFKIGNHQVRTKKYSEVQSYYLNFQGKKCDRSLPRCWQNYASFYITLPNGDIVNLGHDAEAAELPLFNMDPDRIYTDRLILKNIFRDQANDYYNGSMDCLALEDSNLLKDYGLKYYGGLQNTKGEAVQIEVKMQKLDRLTNDQRQNFEKNNKLMNLINLTPDSADKSISCAGKVTSVFRR